MRISKMRSISIKNENRGKKRDKTVTTSFLIKKTQCFY